MFVFCFSELNVLQLNELTRDRHNQVRENVIQYVYTACNLFHCDDVLFIDHLNVIANL